MDGLTEPGVPVSRDALLPGEAFRAAGTEAERQVAAIWCAALKLDRVGLDDNFFDLGGDSLSATEIATAASAAFGTEIQPGQLMALCTVAEFAGFADGHEEASAVSIPAHIAIASRTGSGAPVFVIHGRFGFAFPNPEFLNGLYGRHPVYYVNAIGFYEDRETPRTLEDTADAYLDSIRRVAPSGEYHLAGMCSGGGIAHEMGRQADLAADPALSVTLIDPPFSRMTGVRKTSAWRDKWERALRISRQSLAFSVRRSLGRVKGEAGRLATTADNFELLSRYTAISDGNLERFEGLRRSRISSAQMALEVMLASARHKPWRGPVSLLVSTQRNARVKAEAWRRFTPTHDVRLIDCAHDDLFGTSAGATGAALADLIDKAEERARTRAAG